MLAGISLKNTSKINTLTCFILKMNIKLILQLRNILKFLLVTQ